VELDPLSVTATSILGYIYSIRGEYDLAIAQHRRAMELDSGWYFPHYLLALTYVHMGRLEEAIAEAEAAYEFSGHNAITLGLLGAAYGRAGRLSETHALLEQVKTHPQTTYVPPYAVVALYHSLGEVEQAFEWMEKAVEERDVILVCALKTEPRYTSLHGYPRYQALLRKMNLEP